MSVGPDTAFGWLNAAISNNYSQHGEDGVVDTIFSRIWAENKWCFECGAADGLFFSNTRRLLNKDWTGILIEKDQELYKRLVKNSQKYGDKAHVACATLSELDPVLAAFGAPEDIDLVVIDVDGQDYHLFNSMLRFRPRVIVVEFDVNAPDEWYIPERGEDPHGAGVMAMVRMAKGRFYREVWRSWGNLVFVKEPLDRMLMVRE